MNRRLAMQLFTTQLLVTVMGSHILAGSSLFAQTVSIQEFVRSVHYDGIPYDDARLYPTSLAPGLLRMLDDPAEAPYWVNIAGVLGMIGDESVVTPLVAFARRGNGVLTPDEYRAKTTVLIALGYVVNHTGSRLALDYLLSSVSPDVWDARGFLWTSPFHATSGERDARLSKTALLGLALSAAPEAGELLRTLTRGASPAVRLTPGQAAAMRQPSQEALLEFDAVSRLGLSQYYSQRQSPDERR